MFLKEKEKHAKKKGEYLLNNDVLIELKKEERQLAFLKEKLESNLEHAPDGSLRVNGTQGRKAQYYQYIPENKEKSKYGTYLGSNKQDVVKRLAQKSYDGKMLEWVKSATYRLQNLIDSYEHNTPEILYNRLSDIRRQLVTPYYIPDDVFLEKWLNKWRLEENTYEKRDNILTERGEYVRSKSEKIIADKLYAEGIPYVYEPQVILTDGERVYPDFATLNIRTRREYFLEHFGRMDEIGYCRKNIRKIEEYALSGYTLGDGLLATFETNGNIFDIKYLEELIKRYLK